MRVLLVQSWLGGAEPPVYPVGLACIAAALPDHEVRIFDPNVEADADAVFSKLTALLAEFDPQVIGISLRNIDSTNKREVVFYYQEFRTLLQHIHARTIAPIIVGGAGFSLFAERIMHENPSIFAGVYLEGEETMAALLLHLDAPALVPGVYYREHGALQFSGPPPKLDVSKTQNIFAQASGFSRYPNLDHGPEPIGVESKRGCALHCIYCPYGFLNGREYRLLKPSDVVDRIESLYSMHKISCFTFLDSVFNIPRSHAEAICDELLTRNIAVQWSAWFNENQMDGPFIEKCLKAGCTTFILSPDGITDSTLRTLGKSQRRADILRVWRILVQQAKVNPNFEVSYNFFKNPPGQTWLGFVQLIVFLFRAKLTLRRRVHFEVNSLRIEPHTTLHAIALKERVCSEDTDLLQPTYYTQKKTALIESFWNKVLMLLGK
ncbi:B12-binding domain-containing radical SAM protein [Megalodesulfovibrio paquesii]